MLATPRKKVIKHAHLFCGLGGAAKGFNRGHATLGSMEAVYECIGGIDICPSAIADFTRAAGVQGTVLDLMSFDQYVRFHGRTPPPGWREATIEDIHRAFNNQRPNVCVTSPPCKGFSGLLSESISKTDRYQALNELTVRGLWLLLEAYASDPIELICLENVPRIAKRGRYLVDQMRAVLSHFGYANVESEHDCGEIGGLAQHRRRFLLVARHRAKVPPYLYEPPKRRVRAVGELLDKMPLPGDPRGGAMHRVPLLQFQTWTRLAFVEAGKDWRSLNRLAVENGVLRDYGIVPVQPLRSGAYGVRQWDEASGVVAGESLPSNGNFAVADPRAASSWEGSGYLGVNAYNEASGAVSGNGRPGAGNYSVADPRFDAHPRSVQLGVRSINEPAPTVTGNMWPGAGPNCISDPRIGETGPRFNNVYRIVHYGDAAPAVTGQGGNSMSAVADPRGADNRQVNRKYRITGYQETAGSVIAASTTGQGAFAVQDPRTGYGCASHQNKFALTPYDDTSRTVTGADQIQAGALSVADPRPVGLNRPERTSYMTNAAYGVLPFDEAAGAVPGFAKYDRGPWCIADPRLSTATAADALPQPNDRLACVIIAEDGTWHRPFTTAELAVLQGLFDPEEEYHLDGKSDQRIREKIGNAIPPPAATAIASAMAKTLLLAWSGESFALADTPVWVAPIARALTLETPDYHAF